MFIIVLFEVEIYVNCFINLKFVFVTGCDFGVVLLNVSCVMVLLFYLYIIVLEFVSFLNCLLLVVLVLVNGNVSVGFY